MSVLLAGQEPIGPNEQGANVIRGLEPRLSLSANFNRVISDQPNFEERTAYDLSGD